MGLPEAVPPPREGVAEGVVHAPPHALLLEPQPGPEHLPAILRPGGGEELLRGKDGLLPDGGCPPGVVAGGPPQIPVGPQIALRKLRHPDPLSLFEGQDRSGSEAHILIPGGGEEHIQLFFQKVVDRRQVAALRRGGEDPGQGDLRSTQVCGVAVKPGEVFRHLPPGFFRLQGRRTGGFPHEEGIFPRDRLVGERDLLPRYHVQILLEFQSRETDHAVGVSSHHDHGFFRVHLDGGAAEHGGQDQQKRCDFFHFGVSFISRAWEPTARRRNRRRSPSWDSFSGI